jgi:hypothetical protein
MNRPFPACSRPATTAPIWREVVLAFAAVVVSAVASSAAIAALRAHAEADELAAGVREPPMSARPRVFWFWMGKNVSREGITADLEAMKQAGIGGLIHMAIPDSVGSWDAFEIANSPTPENRMFSKPWWNLLTFAMSEAGRLGMFVDCHVCPGYSTCGGPWITPERSMQLLAFSSIELDGRGSAHATLPRPAIKQIPCRFYNNMLYDTKGFYRDVGAVAVPKNQDTGEPDLARGVDVSDQMRPDGTLDWRPPGPGRWVVYRVGRHSSGRCIHPCPPEAIGLEADKWSASAMEINYRSYAGKLLDMLDDDGRRALRAVHIDSYEAGPQNWTETFREDFRKRRGYDPLPFLPVLSVDPKIITDDRARRFLYDFDRTTTELFAERMLGKTAELAHRDGLVFSCEPYGGGLLTPEMLPMIDQPMCEFWNTPPGDGVSLPAAYSGKGFVGAEAFTCEPQFPGAKMAAVPMTFIPRAHGAFARGVNMLYFHCYPHQPFPDSVRPGMTMGQWGTQIGRTTTWWKQSRPFFDYFARCQYMLQQGVRVLDVLDMRSCPTKVFLNDLVVRDGRMCLPDGNSFAWIRLTDDRAMRLDIARRLKELVAAGAIVVGPKPDNAPGLEGYPASVEAVKGIAAELWGNCDGKKVRRHRYGHGLILWNDDPAKAIDRYVPDCVVNQASPGGRFEAIHRRTTEGADIYFVVNAAATRARAIFDFRTVGRVPELWDATDGSIREAAAWRRNGEQQTKVALDFEGYHAVFVVFRKPPSRPEPSIEPIEPGPIRDATETLVVLDGPWQVTFPPGLGAPAKITLPRLINLSEHSDAGVKYFSGTATYVNNLTLSADQLTKAGSMIQLDLGDVRDVITVRVNSRELGILWRPPYRLDVTKSLHPGRNRLELDVTNTWVNRLIGDQQEPDDCQWYPDQRWGGQNIGAPLRAFPDWFADYLKTGNRPSKGRRTFVVWNKYKKDSRLPPSGLLGPVVVNSVAR